MSSPTDAGRKALDSNWSILSPAEQQTAKLLLDNDQSHLFAHWPAAGVEDEQKHKFLQQCAQIEHAYLGGITQYVKRAKELLSFADAGGNPYEGYQVREPSAGARLETQQDFDKYESLGMQHMAQTGFVIVAGGLGERLGYKGIKLALPSEIVTETTFIELYCKTILALQTRAQQLINNPNLLIPFAIMTSDDTDTMTRELLSKNNNFGMKQEQLTVFKQGKVPSLVDNEAHFCLEENDKYALDTKPHGHGDVHLLLYQNGIVERWVEQMNTKWIVFFQDTNGLVFRAIPAAIGVSVEKELQMNSLTVPRVQGDAVGAICTLVRDANFKATGEQLPNTLTINVEYNQLEGLMGKGVKEPLIPGTLNSVYPGNTNVLVFDAVSYLQVLRAKKGVISEFVNPKYNPDKKSFKKPTRLECMMQDYPKLLDEKARVGFTQFQKWTSFSPVKNAIADGVAKQQSNNAAEVAATGEADIYNWSARILKENGVNVADPTEQTYKGIKVNIGPKIVLAPAAGTTQAEIRQKFVGGQNISISGKSTLVVDAQDITIKSLKLDGTLVIHAVPGAKVVVQDLVVANDGWSLQELSGNEEVPQKYSVRGYVLQKRAAQVVQFSAPGEYVLDNQTIKQYSQP